MGLLLRTIGEADESLAAFEKAGTLRPADPHTQYFIGLSAAQVAEYDRAIAAFRRALELDEFLVSAEFGLARALQRAGRGDEAKAHIDRFQRLTTEKVATAMSLAYGDQGPLSLAEAVLPKDAPPVPTVPVTFVAAAEQPFQLAAGRQHAFRRARAAPPSARAGASSTSTPTSRSTTSRSRRRRPPAAPTPWCSTAAPAAAASSG
jgi:tetratricopeptide (TPR) repeat protein